MTKGTLVMNGIDYSNGGLGGCAKGIDYSTEEQDTGLKWIDGKKIYQITYTDSIIRNTYANVNLFQISNLKDYVSISALIKNNTTWRISNVIQREGSIEYNSYIDAYSDGNINLVTGASSACKGVIITVQYTKTTD